MNASEGHLRLPRNLAELTAEWLSAALATRYPGVEVTSVHVGTVSHGTNTRARLMLTYNEAGHAHRLPPTMWAKCGFEVHTPQVAECNRSEVVFYSQRASEGLLNSARCYLARSEESSGSSFLLLEDLLARNVTFGFPEVRPIDPEIARRALAMLARYHARWWNSAGPVKQVSSANGEIVTDMFFSKSNFEDCTHLPRFEYVPPPLRSRERFLGAIYKLWDSNLQGPRCIVHGDPDLGNSFFELDGTPGFLDVQGDTLGCWAHDFTEFVITALDIDARRNFERPLLEFYLEQLRSHGVDAPTFGKAWLQYRRNTLWMSTAAVLPVAFRPESVCTAYTRRTMAAVMDLDALGSFDE